jgi:hypothetical protein
MKYSTIKMIKNIILKIKQNACKHNSKKTSASCPYTGKTYTYCLNCLKQISVSDS